MPGAYRFAGFRLELDKRRLIGLDGAPIPLSSRAYDVLVHLVENRDRVVGKDELMKAVWSETIVEENNLNQAISGARRALGDSRDAPSFIVTVAGRGYRFVGEVDTLVDRSLESAPEASPSAAAKPGIELPVNPPGQAGEGKRWSRRAVVSGVVVTTGAVAGGGILWWKHSSGRPRPVRSIAVLPFKPLLPDARNPAMELGITELLTNRLSRLPGIVVVPLSSVRRFSAPDSDPLEAGRQLGVDAVIDGHVHTQENQVRLTARLLATQDRASLWANTYTERIGALLSVQDSLALQLANALSSELSGEARSGMVAHATSDVEAWQLYANGRYHSERRTADGLRRAAAFYAASLERDPRFALASAGLSDVHTLTAVFGIDPPKKAFAQARRAALRALELDPQSPAAHTAVGHVATQYDRDLAEGRRHYLRALALRPQFTYALLLMGINLVQAGDLAGATEYVRKARAVEPASLAVIAVHGFLTYFKRAFDEAEKELARLVEAAPDAALPMQQLAHVLLAKRQGERVVRLLEDRNYPAPMAFSNLARAYVQVNNLPAARAEIARVENLGAQGFGVGYNLAMIHTELGDHARALDALERGMSDHSQNQCFLNAEAALDPIRGEPRFREVVRKLGLG